MTKERKGEIYYISKNLALLIDKFTDEIEEALGVKMDKIKTSELIAKELDEVDVNNIIKKIERGK